MALDFGTLQVASIVSRVAFTSVFLVTLLRHPREIYFAVWASALVSSLAASFLMLGDPPSVPLGAARGAVIYVLYGASLAVSWVGLRLFHERPLRLPQALMLTLGPGLLYGGLMWLGVPLEWCFTVLFGSLAVSTGLCAVEILRTPVKERLWTQYAVLSGFVGYTAVFLVSILVIHFANEHLATPESGVYALLFDQWCGVFIQVGYLAMVSERAQVRISRLADTDPLTGLPNRRGLAAALDRRAATQDRGLSGAVLVIDIDHFKSINDTYGHESGDRVLADVAARLQGIMRADDIVARWGGEEFLAVLGRADGAAAVAIAERLREAVSGRAFVLDRGPIAVTVSIGAALVAAGETKIDAAVARADTALYAAKRDGRNRAVLNPPEPAPQDRGRVA